MRYLRPSVSSFPQQTTKSSFPWYPCWLLLSVLTEVIALFHSICPLSLTSPSPLKNSSLSLPLKTPENHCFRQYSWYPCWLLLSVPTLFHSICPPAAGNSPQNFPSSWKFPLPLPKPSVSPFSLERITKCPSEWAAAVKMRRKKIDPLCNTYFVECLHFISQSIWKIW